MYAFLLMSAAALASAQPVPAPSGSAVGPLQNPGPSREQIADTVATDPQPRPVRLELPNVADGAELRVKGSGLKLKVPI